MNRDTSNLTRYVESASIDYRLLKKVETQELKESIQKCNLRLRESIDSCSDGWWVPISFYNKRNSNGRIYNKDLWENVINNQRDVWVGAPMLADHPQGDSDGTPLNICGVWIDAKMDTPDYRNEGLVYGLLVPSGHIGEDLKAHLSNGLKVGTSSSGFGKLLSDGVTVDPNSFVIERLSDWVLNPSQGTFFSYDESEEDIQNRCRESVSNKVERENTDRENFVKDSRITRLEEKKFRRDMESFLESASNIKDPQERLQEFKEIKSYLEDGACPDLKEKIEQKIREEEEFIRVALKEKIELKEEFQIESTRDLKEKLTKIVEDTSVLNKEIQDWKQISENLQGKLEEATKELNERPTESYVSFLKEKNEAIATLNEELYKKIEELNEKHNNSLADLREELCEAREESSNKIENLNKLHKKNSIVIDKTQQNIKEKNIMLVESSSRIAELMEVISGLNRTLQEKEEEKKAYFNSKFYENNEKRKVLLKELYAKLKEEAVVKAELLKEKNSYNAEINKLQEQITALKNKNSKLQEGLLQATNLLKESQSLTKKNNVKYQESQNELSSLKRNLRKAEIEEQRKLELSIREANMTVTDKYFESLRAEYGTVMDKFEERIREAVNLTEAKRVFFSEILPRIQEGSVSEETFVGREHLKENAIEGEKALDIMLDNLPKGWF